MVWGDGGGGGDMARREGGVGADEIVDDVE